MNVLGLMVYAFFLSLPLFPTTSFAEDTWTLKKDENGIKVYYRERADGYTEFRGITIIRSSLSSFVALFQDLKTMPTWVDRTISAVNLKQVSDTEAYVHIINDMPWPFKDREVVIHTIIEQDPLNLSVNIRGTDDKNQVPLKSDYVRTHKVKSHWLFSPLQDGTVEVLFQGYGDAGGNMSSKLLHWFVNLALWESPYNTLQGMRAIIHQEKYQHQTFPFIQEPDLPSPTLK
ncbi:hypothetical protein MNBD_NITROSPIRAE01-568 [hydrothermal vent metagenome]|uniref:START domain-containing protein n=1 Tax=hydrothermal vent metagenome TaxID=652676 RepID=A0A3B1D9D2_9ZZZZ